MKDFIKAFIICGLVVLVSYSLSGCDNTRVKIGAAYATKSDLRGSNPHAIFEVEQTINEDVICSYWHVSHYFTGFPFNTDPEGSIDMFGCSYVLGPKYKKK